jgi:hypothetical protein
MPAAAWCPESTQIAVWNPSRLRRPAVPAILAPARRAADAEDRSPAGESVDAQYVFTRADLQPVLGAIRASLGDGTVPLDSPLRLQDALATVIHGLGGRGRVAVRRSPAALLTPEYWQIGLAGLDVPTHAALFEIFRAGRP